MTNREIQHYVAKEINVEYGNIYIRKNSLENPSSFCLPSKELSKCRRNKLVVFIDVINKKAFRIDGEDLTHFGYWATKKVEHPYGVTSYIRLKCWRTSNLDEDSILTDKLFGRR